MSDPTREALILERVEVMQSLQDQPNAATLIRRNAQISVALGDAEAAAGPARDIVRWADEAAAILSCPNCNALVTLKAGELAPADPEAQDMVRPPEEVQAARAQITAYEQKVEELNAERTKNIALIQETKKRTGALRQRLAEIDRELRPPEATS